MLNLEAKIEGLLFYKGEDVEIKKISDIFKVSVEEVEEALKNLDLSLSNRGLVLVRKDDRVILGITKELSPIIEEMRKDEITKELTKSSLETLSIVIYKDGVTRSEIDYIRGVNSSFILRNLLVRGLIEKVVDPKDSRRFLYKPTFETLSFMGIKSINELPDYENIRSQLKEIENNEEKND
ncbi:MAG: SMC-Scp complex subunit ScpB [Candidatus Moranbacteria bacterium]|nr:SMC-Scp complex subunit ScpB [Candidatus Moranbacteria bacterium]